MKAGDLVRFKHSYEMYKNNTWDIGILIEYEKWEKVATILFNGTLWRIRAHDIQKAGKADGL